MNDQETQAALVRLASGQWLSSHERMLVIRAMDGERARADELEYSHGKLLVDLAVAGNRELELRERVDELEEMLDGNSEKVFDPLWPSEEEAVVTDCERIERLTELARKVFGEELSDRIAPIEYHEGEAPSGMHTALVRLHGRWGELASVKHPHALDALEAALLVLDGQLLAQPWQAEMFSDLVGVREREAERYEKRIAELEERLEIICDGKEDGHD